MKVLLSGVACQPGQGFVAWRAEGVEIIDCRREKLALAEAPGCRQVVLEHLPGWVLKVGALAAVYKTVSEAELAAAVNNDAPGAFVQALAETGGQLLQVSTDYIFNGEQGRPYRPDQALDPLEVYRGTKSAAWEAMGVVAHQVCSLASTHTLEVDCWRSIGAAAGDGAADGVRQWSDAVTAKWYAFPVAIGKIGVEPSQLARPGRAIPIATAKCLKQALQHFYSSLTCAAECRAAHLEPLHLSQPLLQVLESMECRSHARRSSQSSRLVKGLNCHQQVPRIDAVFPHLRRPDDHQPQTL